LTSAHEKLKESGTLSHTVPNAPEEFPANPAGSLRLLPSVSFATRAAALTSVALPVAMLAASVLAAGPAAAADGVTVMGTTCCPPVNP
jgi:hypothetical protein